MASSPRQEFPTELGTAIADKASALLQSVRRTSFQEAEVLSVEKTQDDTNSSSYQGKGGPPRLSILSSRSGSHMLPPRTP